MKWEFNFDRLSDQQLKDLREFYLDNSKKAIDSSGFMKPVRKTFVVEQGDTGNTPCGILGSDLEIERD